MHTIHQVTTSNPGRNIMYVVSRNAHKLNRQQQLTRCALHVRDLRPRESRGGHKSGCGAQRAQSHSTNFHLHDTEYVVNDTVFDKADDCREQTDRFTRGRALSVELSSTQGLGCPRENDPRLQAFSNLPFMLK